MNNEGQQKASDIINSGGNVFVTGAGGSGKSYLINTIKDDNTVLVAPTGIAALNIGGITCHSFFGLPFGLPEPSDRYKLPAKACYQDVLETDTHFEDILTIHAEQDDKSEEWLAEVRLNKCHDAKEIVSEFKEHPVQMAMTKSKRFIPAHATSRTSFRGMLNYTQESVNQWKEFNEGVANSDALNDVKAELESTKWDVQRLNDTLKLAPVDKKEKAKYLVSKGYSHQKAADIVGVNKKTVTRWCKGNL